ncbi:hypothetical protein I7I51_07612 [Histoplasma capsulatum]|uniref:Uncharacterized protein n=1 Tax=Ajellomyces capsulatus TaxID=5037 RepID=A0A8A1LW94_AJECA|nr:hypothetical protein I7I51_07612 [Histoplasma capsulatum]
MERPRNQQEPCEAEDYPEEVDRERVAQAAHPEQDASAQIENASKRVTQLDRRSLLGQRSEKDEHSGEPRPEASSQAASGQGRIRIVFKILERGNWREADTVSVDPAEIDQNGRCSVVERLVM